jgi:hypothetical protein
VTRNRPGPGSSRAAGPSTPPTQRQALADPGQLPAGELDNAVEFTDEDEAAFLRRLWQDLYGAEPT